MVNVYLIKKDIQHKIEPNLLQDRDGKLRVSRDSRVALGKVSRLFFDFVSSYTTLIQFITGSAGTAVTGKVADNSSSNTIENNDGQLYIQDDDDG